MTDVHCHLIYHCTSPHVAQVYAGLELLKSSRVIRLTQQRMDARDFERVVPYQEQLFVVVNGTCRVFYDMHDGGIVNEAAAAECDLYFKRSYDASRVRAEFRDKVRPFGLNYEVHSGRLNRYHLIRAARVRSAHTTPVQRLTHVLRQMSPRGATFVPTVQNMSAPPDPDQPPRVLFIVRAWDPANNPNLTPADVEFWHYLNATRARCIELLKQEFGEAFVGGFVHSPFTQRQYAKLLLHDPSVARKGSYTRMVRAHSIGIATTGLHGSIGWKFAEYVAFSKAIVSEPLRYTVPGPLAADRNYLEFTTPEECVERVRTLFDRPELRVEMMQRNHEYYEAYMRPDLLMMRTLRQVPALAGAPEPIGA